MSLKFIVFFMVIFWSTTHIQATERNTAITEITKQIADLINNRGDGTNFSTDNHFVLRCVSDNRIEIRMPYNTVLECTDSAIKKLTILVMEDYFAKKDEDKIAIESREQTNYRLITSEGKTNFIYGSIINPDIKKLVRKPLLIASGPITKKSSKCPKLPKTTKLKSKTLKALPSDIKALIVCASKFASKTIKKSHI